MLLDFIILVLRETLEASLLISVMLTVGFRLSVSTKWLFIALTLGLISATIYALCLPTISTWFEYVGQEVFGAGLQYTIYTLILGVLIIQSRPRIESTRPIQLMMIATVAIATTREGGELIVFYGGFLQGGGHWVNAATSGMIGLAIGASIGVLVYYTLVGLPQNLARPITTLLLTLIAGGMVMQATQLLIQADWLAGHPTLWDSTWLLAESSIAGQAAYALFGYEATPSAHAMTAYLGAVLLIGFAWRIASKPSRSGSINV